jgi:hypothetical protein
MLLLVLQEPQGLLAACCGTSCELQLDALAHLLVVWLAKAHMFWPAELFCILQAAHVDPHTPIRRHTGHTLSSTHTSNMHTVIRTL